MVRWVAKWILHLVAAVALVVSVMNLCCKERLYALFDITLMPLKMAYCNYKAPPLPEWIENDLSPYEWCLYPKDLGEIGLWIEAKRVVRIERAKKALAVKGWVDFYRERKFYELSRALAQKDCNESIPIESDEPGVEGFICRVSEKAGTGYLYFENELKRVTMPICYEEMIPYFFELAKGVRKRERSEGEKDER